jgi:hypothetical protein
MSDANSPMGLLDKAVLGVGVVLEVLAETQES